MSVLVLWAIMPLIRYVLDIEFATDDFKSSYKEFLFFAVPIALLFTLTGTLKPKDTAGIVILKTLGTVGVAFVIMFIMFMSIFADMCAYYNEDVLYEHKDDPSTQIVVRSFGCGATDSSPASMHVQQLEYFTKYFIRATAIDTATIDKSQWNKVN